MRPHRHALLPLLPALLALAAGCEQPRDLELAPADLTAGERLYVGRVLVLERAKAVALQDRPRGDALLDSLAAAWGDSSLAETAAGLPDDPRRAAAVGRLLSILLQAEQDSFMLAPRADRLDAPWPWPPPAPDEAAGEPGGGAAGG